MGAKLAPVSVINTLKNANNGMDAPTHHLGLYLLGGLSVRAGDGAELALPTRKARALLAYLALSPGASRSREQIACLLWERSADEQARGSLRQQLSAIRKALGPDAEKILKVDNQQVALNIDKVFVDALVLLQLLESPSAEDVPLILSLCKGGLLEGFNLNEQGFDDWLATESSRWQGLLMKGLIRLAASLLASGSLESAEQLLALVLASDSFNEQANVMMMKLLISSHRREEAIRHYQAYASSLTAELGVEPANSLRQLLEEARQESAAEAPAEAVPESFQQQLRFCESYDGTRLAYATSGEGPPLVKVSHWLSHLDYDWRSPMCRHSTLAFSEDHTLIRYDKRGCGLSQREGFRVNFDSWVKDLTAVVDAQGLERFALFGPSQGGAIAVEYAYRYPERVSHLIILGGFAHIGLDAQAIERERAMLKLIKTGWGQKNPAFKQLFTSLMIPQGSREQQDGLNHMQEVSTNAAMAAAIYWEIGQIDVREHARQLNVPTLILHARDDARISLNNGTELASLIPGARFVCLDSVNHILMEDEPAWHHALKEIRAFLSD